MFLNYYNVTGFARLIRDATAVFNVQLRRRTAQ